MSLLGRSTEDIETWKEVAGRGRWGMSSQAWLVVMEGSRAPQWQGAQAEPPLGKKSTPLWDLSNAIFWRVPECWGVVPECGRNVKAG